MTLPFASMTGPARHAIHAALAAILMALLLAAGPVRAQEAAQAPAAEQAPAGNLDQRVRNIEEQLLEIQTLLGTLQSLVRGGGGAAAPAPGGVSAGGLPGEGGDSDQRLRVMETQINALSRQVEQLTGQLSNLGVSGSDQPSSGQPAPQFGTVTVPPEPQQQQQLPQFPPLAQQPQSPQSQAPQPQGGQPAPDLRGGDSGLGQLGAQPQSPAPQTAALSPEQARVLYDQAYGNLVRRDFAAAEQGFRQFLTSFPSDQLSGNAQYWLGETYFLRNQYKQAADNFLKAYQRYPTGSKAPESLLRLGTSLAQLGNKEDACSTIAEVSRKFPDAPDYLKQRAATESRRAGC